MTIGSSLGSSSMKMNTSSLNSWWPLFRYYSLPRHTLAPRVSPPPSWITKWNNILYGMALLPYIDQGRVQCQTWFSFHSFHFNHHCPSLSPLPRVTTANSAVISSWLERVVRKWLRFEDVQLQLALRHVLRLRQELSKKQEARSVWH